MNTIKLDKEQVRILIELLNSYRYILKERLKLPENKKLELVFTYFCDKYQKMN